MKLIKNDHDVNFNYYSKYPEYLKTIWVYEELTWRALHYAVSKNAKESVKILCLNGANVNDKTK